MTETDWLRSVDGGIILTIWAQPRASRTQVTGRRGGALKLQLAAPPVDGEANAVLTKFLSKQLGVPKSAIELLRGETGRNKQVRVAGVTVEQVRAALAP